VHLRLSGFVLPMGLLNVGKGPIMTDTESPAGGSLALWAFATTLLVLDYEPFQAEVIALNALGKSRRPEPEIIAALSEFAERVCGKSIDTGASESAGRDAAFAVIALASTLEGEKRRDLFASVSELQTTLRTGHVPPVKL
jgi:hypothetical protein